MRDRIQRLRQERFDLELTPVASPIADRQICLLACDIRVAMIDIEFDAQRRCFALQSSLAFEEPQLGEPGHHTEFDQSEAARRAPLIRRTVDDAERLLDPADEALPVRCQPHASRMAFEQCRAEPVLHSSNPPANRAMREAGHPGGRQKRALTRDSANCFEAGKRWPRAWRRRRGRR